MRYIGRIFCTELDSESMLSNKSSLTQISLTQKTWNISWSNWYGFTLIYTGLKTTAEPGLTFVCAKIVVLILDYNCRAYFPWHIHEVILIIIIPNQGLPICHNPFHFTVALLTVLIDGDLLYMTSKVAKIAHQSQNNRFLEWENLSWFNQALGFYPEKTYFISGFLFPDAHYLLS